MPFGTLDEHGANMQSCITVQKQGQEENLNFCSLDKNMLLACSHVDLR